MKLTNVEKRELNQYCEWYDFHNEFNNKVFLITGAGGMTGTAVIKWLLYLNYKYNSGIRIVASTRSVNVVPNYIENGDAIEFCEFGKEDECFNSENIDYVIHGAAPTSREFFISKPVETLRIIVDQTEHLLDLVKKVPNTIFLYLSSMDIYGTIDEDNPVSEEYVSAIDVQNIRSGYPLGKKTAEFLCHAYHNEYGVKCRILRPASIQGLFQSYDEPRVFNELMRCVVENKDFCLKSEGRGKKCFMYTLDVVSAIFKILILGKDDSTYNATNRETYIELRDLISQVFESFSPNNKLYFDIDETAGYLPPFSFLQDDSLLRELGWEPKRGINDIYRIDVERFMGGKR